MAMGRQPDAAVTIGVADATGADVVMLRSVDFGLNGPQLALRQL